MLARDTLLVTCLVGLSACMVSRDGLGQRIAAEDPVQADDPPPSDEDEPSEEVPEPEPPAADASVDVRTGAGACAVEGVHAFRIDVDVSWTPDVRWSAYRGWSPAVSSGQGKVSLLALVDVQDGRATLRACGASLPAVRGVAGATVSGTIADATWDAVSTRWSAQVTTSCEQPGCALSSSFVQPTLGLDLPAGADWPAVEAPVPAALLRDDDGDGPPGIRFTLDEPLRMFAPTGLNWANSVQVTDLHLALRLGTQLTGKVDGCGAASGNASKLTLDSRVLGCTLDSGSACLDEQTAALQQSLPSWTVDGSAWRLLRLVEGSDCEDVRGALL